MGSEISKAPQKKKVDPEMLANLELLEDFDVFSAEVELDFLSELEADEELEQDAIKDANSGGDK